MSSQGTTREVDPTQLVSTVLDKTKAGKLSWDETADESVFLASVGGNTTLEVRSPSELSPLSEGFSYTLSLLDGNGKLLWEIREPQTLIQELFELARRMALKVDEKVEAFLETLQKL
jgi:hypothetical protein